LPGWQAAGKTGTSQDYRDAWFVGYTSHLVAGVWLGNDDSSPTKKVSGANLPVEIWSRFMRDAHKGIPAAPLPSGVWRDPVQPMPPPSFTPPADVPMASNQPMPLPLPQASPPAQIAPQAQPVAVRQIGGPVRPGAPRRDPIADLIPPASIPQGSAIRRTAPPPEKGFLQSLFGG
jgi:penicillin-binding protein 1A